MACRRSRAFSELWIRMEMDLVSLEARIRIHRTFPSLSSTICRTNREIRVVRPPEGKKMWLYERIQASNFYLTMVCLQMEDLSLASEFQILFRWSGMTITTAQYWIERRVLVKTVMLQDHTQEINLSRSRRISFSPMDKYYIMYKHR